MIARVRAKFAEGVLKPLDRLDLEDGCEVLVSIEDDGTQAAATDGSNGERARVDEPQKSEGGTGTPSSGYLLKSQREAAQRLIAMGGSAPDIEGIPRRRSSPSSEPGHDDDEVGQ